MTRKYAGIGARETPADYLELMQNWASWFASGGVLLRSGGAAGADKAFERGCGFGPKRIFYPCDREDWLEHAAHFHPNWSACSNYAKQLHARNSAIICGENLDDPVDFVICWTKNGEAIGGTGQALRVAEHYNIPVFNLQRADTASRMYGFFK